MDRSRLALCHGIFFLRTRLSCAAQFLLNHAEFHELLQAHRSFILAFMLLAVFAVHVHFFTDTPACNLFPDCSGKLNQ